MPKHRIPKRASKKPASNKRIMLRILFVVILILAATLVTKAIIHHIQTSQKFAEDKIRYTKAEKDMASAYNSVVQRVGEPYDMNIAKNCAYGSLKFVRGPLGCTITYTFSYQVSSVAASQEDGKEILDIISDDPGFDTGTPFYGLSEWSKSGGDYSLFANNRNALGCTLVHTTYPAEDYNTFGKQILHLSKKALADVSTYTFGCESNVYGPVYDITKSIE